MDNVLLDYEHQVTNKIKKYADRADFPKMEDYGIDQRALDDYLFDKQAILDSEGSQKSQYTLTGVLIVLPVLVISAIPDANLPWGEWSLFVAIGIGIVLALLAKALQKLIIQMRLRKLYEPKVESFIEAVFKYNENN